MRMEKIKMDKAYKLKISAVLTIAIFAAMVAALLVGQRVKHEQFLASHPVKRVIRQTVTDRIVVNKVIVDKPKAQAAVPSSSGSGGSYNNNYSSGSSSSGSNSYSAPSYSAPAYSPPVVSAPAPAPSTSSAS